MCPCALCRGQSLYDEGGETTRRQLLTNCLSLQIASEACLDQLIDIWKGGVRRVYQHYQLSAQAYFTFLKLNGQVGQLFAPLLGGLQRTKSI